MKHFEYYPKVEYSNNLAVNIMVRGKIRDAVLKDTALYYKYTVSDNLSAESISYKYYNDSNKVWAIYYANNMFDPIRDWPMTYTQFQKFIISKYGSIQKTSTKFNKDGSICWDSIHHFVHRDPETKIEYVIDKQTFLRDHTSNPETTYSVTFYEHEYALNEAKRKIVVLDSVHLIKIVSEMRNLFSS